jgi:hypothetical protein
MRVQLAIAAFLLSSCTTNVHVRGRYAAALSAADVQQIRRLAQDSPHFGHTLVTLDALQRDRVHVRTREYVERSWSGSNMYVVRRDGEWLVDDHSPILGEAETTITVY